MFLTVIAWTLSAAAVPAATDVNGAGGRTETVPLTFEPVPLRLVSEMAASLSEPPSCSWWYHATRLTAAAKIGR